MQNRDIRRAAAVCGVRQWQIADRLGMADSNFSRLLRRELPAEKKKQIRAIIRQLSTDN